MSTKNFKSTFIAHIMFYCTELLEKDEENKDSLIDILVFILCQQLENFLDLMTELERSCVGGGVWNKKNLLTIVMVQFNKSTAVQYDIHMLFIFC